MYVFGKNRFETLLSVLKHGLNVQCPKNVCWLSHLICINQGAINRGRRDEIVLFGCQEKLCEEKRVTLTDVSRPQRNRRFINLG